MIARPGAERFAALAPAQWAVLLPVLRAALADLDGPARSERVRDLLARPTSELADVRGRRALGDLVASDDAVWTALLARLDPLPTDLDWLAGPSDERHGESRTRTGSLEPEDRDAREARHRDLVRARDEQRRRAEGAEARAAVAARDLASTTAVVAALEAEVARLRARDEDSADERRQAVDRLERRFASERERARAELGAVRQERDRLAQELAALRSRLARAESELAAVSRSRARGEAAARGTRDGVDRVRPGRPSRLPPGVASGTTEAASLLLHPGRLVLVDGYNVTLQHRPAIDLDRQRAWLVTLLGGFVARVPVRAVVVFDGERSGGGGTPPVRGVVVRFTDEATTADDEVVLAVAATDDPVVVVTDDRELRRRVDELGADVIGTREFLGAVGA